MNRPPACTRLTIVDPKAKVASETLKSTANELRHVVGQFKVIG